MIWMQLADNFRGIENCVKNRFPLGTGVLSLTRWIRGLAARQPIRQHVNFFDANCISFPPLMCCRAWKIKEWRSPRQHVPLVQQRAAFNVQENENASEFTLRAGLTFSSAQGPEIFVLESWVQRVPVPGCNLLWNSQMDTVCLQPWWPVICVQVLWAVNSALNSALARAVLFTARAGAGRNQPSSRAKKARFCDWFEHQTKTLLYVHLLPQGCCSGAVLQRWMAGPCAGCLALSTAQQRLCTLGDRWPGLMVCLQGN